MDAKQHLYEMQLQLVDVFKAQDPDTGYFDVVFEIEGKKLYAHRFRLSALSSTFNSMLSDRWNFNKNDAIKIETYKYDDFIEFLIFIYSGECNLNDENIFIIVDMAEFYDVKVLKNVCEKYLSKIIINIQNIFQLLDLADKYSIVLLQKRLNTFVSKNFATLTQSEMFQSIKKGTLENIIEAVKYKVFPEKLFEEIFKWAKNQAIRKKNAEENIILNDAIKEELADILPLLNFRRMDSKFLLEFVVKKSFLFSADEFNDILMGAYTTIHVKVTDKNGKVMKGILNCPDTDKVVEVIQSLKNVPSGGYYWSTYVKKPSTSCDLHKTDNVEWYLVYDYFGDLCLKTRYDDVDEDYQDEDYILAEMFEEDGFQLRSGCKIEVNHFE